MTDMFSGLHDEIARLHQVNMKLEEENDALRKGIREICEKQEDTRKKLVEFWEAIRDKEYDISNEYLNDEEKLRCNFAKLNVLHELMSTLSIKPRRDDENA